MIVKITKILFLWLILIKARHGWTTRMQQADINSNNSMWTRHSHDFWTDMDWGWDSLRSFFIFLWFIHSVAKGEMSESRILHVWIQPSWVKSTMNHVCTVKYRKILTSRGSLLRANVFQTSNDGHYPKNCNIVIDRSLSTQYRARQKFWSITQVVVVFDQASKERGLCIRK